MVMEVRFKPVSKATLYDKKNYVIAKSTCKLLDVYTIYRYNMII